jgi:patatin-related protein
VTSTTPTGPDSAAQAGLQLVDHAPVPPAEADTKELRLALVCYGGVSLAIYMHGVTKELQKLVIASNEYDRDADRENPFPDGSSERVYWDTLAAKERGDIRTRVVVDVISGSSAGGINGICLAKALAHDLDQEGLRRVWLEKGDLKRILAERLFQVVVRRRRDFFFRWIYETFQQMRPRKEGLEQALLPDERPLELYVTVTDFYGYNRAIPISKPARVTERRHRHVLEFRSDRGQLDAAHNPELAFAARTSASFPVAFAPTSLRTIRDNVDAWPGEQELERTLFADYRLSDELVEKTFFVDGGVLDNYPFGHAIEAVRRKAAATEVDRRLVYIEPDPAGRAAAAGRRPGAIKTAVGALSSLPRREPILDDLLIVREFNERVRRVNALVAAASPAIEQLVDRKVESLGGIGTPYADVNRGLIGAAAEDAGHAYQTYVVLKLYSVVEALARLAAELCDYPRGSTHALLVRNALLAWAGEKGLFAPGDRPSPTQVEFLAAFDLGYAERRIRFTVKAVNQLYAQLDSPESFVRPTRGDLNEAKAALYGRLDELSWVVTGVAVQEPLVARARDVFGPERIGELVRAGADGSAFGRDERTALDELERAVKRYLDERLTGFGASLYELVEAIVERWDEAPRARIRGRYLGFPFWDVVVYPIQRLSDVGELNTVEIVRLSPEDTDLLGRRTAEEKLRGTKFGHFGAFFRRKWREHDYLWGRLDGAEHLISLVLDDPRRDAERRALTASAFESVLTEERSNLRRFDRRYRELARSVEELR